ncbi:MAG: hypothetical protein QXS57_05530 [Candidatus Caldarchaeum sp.]
MTEGSNVIVRIRHGGREVEFEGSREEVWAAVNRYFSETLGPVEVLSRLRGEVDVSEIAAKLSGKVLVSEGKVDVLVQGDAKKRIMLCLAAVYVGRRMGMVGTDFLSPKEVAGILRIDERVARARLSELWKSGLVDRNEDGRYRFKPFTSLKLIE